MTDQTFSELWNSLSDRDRSLLRHVADGRSNRALREMFRLAYPQGLLEDCYDALGIPDGPMNERRVMAATRIARMQWEETNQ